jgi:farnesyl diphosphate synthase
MVRPGHAIASRSALDRGRRRTAGPARLTTPVSNPSPSLSDALADAAGRVNDALDQLLPTPRAAHGRVQEAMRYAVNVGGKRMRPFLVMQTSALFGVPPERAMRAAGAIEMVHTYSLVHDDLPCMDDDDLRRGQPTTHRRFDEATAVLAGDALLTLAFEVLAEAATHPEAEVRCRLAGRLARAAGSEGMVGGQMMDIVAPEHDFGQADIERLQRMKTGALFEFSCEAGPILGQAGLDHEGRMRAYAHDLGLAFQIADDLIDATSTAEKAGKAVGKDADAGKATFVSLLGVEGARREALRIAQRASAALDVYGEEAEVLQRFPAFLVERDA